MSLRVLVAKTSRPSRSAMRWRSPASQAAGRPGYWEGDLVIREGRLAKTSGSRRRRCRASAAPPATRAMSSRSYRASSRPARGPGVEIESRAAPWILIPGRSPPAGFPTEPLRRVLAPLQEDSARAGPQHPRPRLDRPADQHHPVPVHNHRADRRRRVARTARTRSPRQTNRSRSSMSVRLSDPPHLAQYRYSRS